MDLLSPTYNVHSHRKPQVIGERVVRNAYLKNLTKIRVSYAVSCGLHPWFVTGIDEAKMLERLRENFATGKMLALGEIGLDSFHPNLDLQKRIFEIQLALASELGLPVIIHRVKALDAMAAILKNFDGKIILHGFHENIRVWEQLNKKGNVYASFGPSILRPSKALVQTVKEIDASKILAETDVSAISITEIYLQLAKLRNLEKQEMLALVNSNSTGVFRLF